jgi:hypothetical protein
VGAAKSAARTSAAAGSKRDRTSMDDFFMVAGGAAF